MKKILILTALFVLFAQSSISMNIPDLKGYVNGYAGMLNNSEVKKISKILENIENSTSNQIYVLIIESLNGEVLENFSIKVAEKWKIGQKNKDNGVLILISENDHKVRIEVGLGLEGSLTDLIAGRIIDNEMVPSLREGKTSLAIQKAISSISIAIKGEFEENDKTSKQQDIEIIKWGISVSIFLVISGTIGMIKLLYGGIAGGILSPLLAYSILGYKGHILIYFFIFGIILGFIARFIIELESSGGSGSSGGNSNYSGGSNSNFSGGGGNFGGGGASGRW